MKLSKLKITVKAYLKLSGLVSLSMILFTTVSEANNIYKPDGLALTRIISHMPLSCMQTIANSNDSCTIETFKDKNCAGYIINGNKQELFYSTAERGFIYFISKKGEGAIEHSNTSDTATFVYAKYKIKEYKGQFFVNDTLVGTAQKGDYIIFWSNMKVSIYDGKKVKIKE